MRARNKIRILACLAIMIGAICIMSGCMSRKEQDRRNEELVAAYPEEVKAYLEEKYGREFCVDPKPIGGGGSPIPFASEDYFTCKYVAWENEEDGYAFWTEVYPVSLKDNRIAEIKDNYCWKFVSSKIKEEIGAKWREVTGEDTKIVIYTRSDIRFGEDINADSEIKDAIESITLPPGFSIYIICPPELGLSENELYNKVEVIANDFYADYVQESEYRLEVGVYETYTKEDFQKIEPEKTERYSWEIEESTYGSNKWFPVELKTRAYVEVDNGGR
nr:hypothetical protein [uncultured Acetatifactor sp.]